MNWRIDIFNVRRPTFVGWMVPVFRWRFKRANSMSCGICESRTRVRRDKHMTRLYVYCWLTIYSLNPAVGGRGASQGASSVCCFLGHVISKPLLTAAVCLLEFSDVMEWDSKIKYHLERIWMDGSSRSGKAVGMDWIDLVEDRDRWRAVVNAVMNFRVP